MEPKETGGPIQEGIKKILESPSMLGASADETQLDQQLLQSLWYSIAGTQSEQELQVQILPFYQKPNLDERKSVLKLVEVLEYLYSKHNYAPLLKALTHPAICEFLKITALSVDPQIRDRSLLCIYLVSSKLTEKNEVASIVQLKKDLLLIHDIVYNKPAESLYFNSQRESHGTPNKRSLTSKPPGSSRFDELFREARISDSAGNSYKSKDFPKEISQEGELFSPFLTRLSIEDDGYQKRNSAPLVSRSSTLDTTEPQAREKTLSNRSGSPSLGTGQLINEVNQQFDPYFQNLHSEVHNSFDFSSLWTDQRRAYGIRSQEYSQPLTTEQQRNSSMAHSNLQFGGSYLDAQALPPIDFNVRSTSLGYQSSGSNSLTTSWQQYGGDQSSLMNPISENAFLKLLSTSESKKPQGSMSQPISTRNSATQHVPQPKNSLTDQQKTEGIVLTPKEMERISKKQNPEIGNLTIKELLDYKKSSCSDKTCRGRVKITSMELFVGQNDAISCRFFHNNTDQRRFPLHKHNLIKSFYKHDKLCGDCFGDPKVHNGRCYFSRNWFEVFFHPKNYKIYPCNNQECQKKSQRRKYCPLYHDLKEREDWDKLLLEEFHYDRTQLQFDVEVTGEIPMSKARSSFPHQESSKLSIVSSTSEGRRTLNDTLKKTQDYSPLQIISSPLSENGTGNFWDDIPTSQSFSNPGISLKKSSFKKLNTNNQEFSSPRFVTMRGQALFPQFSAIENNDLLSSTEYNKGEVLTNENMDNFINNSILKHCIDSEDPGKCELTGIPLKTQAEAVSHYNEKSICEYYIRNTKLEFEFTKVEPNQYNELKNYEGPVLQDSQWEDLLKTVGGFLNAEGGKIYIGADNDGTVKGVSMNKKEFDAFEKKFVAQMLKNISPKVQDCYYTIRKVPVIDEQSEKPVGKDGWNSLIIEITVKQGDKIFFVQKEEYEVCYQRSGAVTRVLKGDQINQLMIDRTSAGK